MTANLFRSVLIFLQNNEVMRRCYIPLTCSEKRSPALILRWVLQRVRSIFTSELHNSLIQLPTITSKTMKWIRLQCLVHINPPGKKRGRSQGFLSTQQTPTPHAPRLSWGTQNSRTNENNCSYFNSNNEEIRFL